MRLMKWFSFLAAVILIISCFTPWVFVESKGITISGVRALGTSFGKPGYLNLLMAAIYILLTFTPSLSAKRINLIIAAINLAWVFRNYIILSRCDGGECPEKKAGLYLVLFAAGLMMLGALLTSPGKHKPTL